MMNNQEIVMGNQQGSLDQTGMMEIPGMPGYYADERGNLLSRRRGDYTKVLSPCIHIARGKKRYVRVKAGGKAHLAHRLIASALVKRTLSSDDVVNHKNGITTDNRPSNLEVVSHRENVSHAVQSGLYCSGEEWYRARGMSKD